MCVYPCVLCVRASVCVCMCARMCVCDDIGDNEPPTGLLCAYWQYISPSQ